MQPVDPTRCPLCGRANACAMAARGGCGSDAACSDCWCCDVAIPAAVLERIPPAARDVACICTDCARGGGDVAAAARAAGQDVDRVRD